MSIGLKNYKRIFSSAGDPSLEGRIAILENNEYKVTYYTIVTGTSGTITPPTNTTFNDGEFGLSGNAILSKIDGSNKVTFETPKTAGNVSVTVSLNTTTGAWLASGAYTDSSVAVIYSLKVKGVNWPYLTYSRIIESEELDGGGGHVIQDNGVNKTQRSKLNFDGTAWTITDDAGNDATKVNINTYVDAMSLNGVDEPTLAFITALRYLSGT